MNDILDEIQSRIEKVRADIVKVTAEMQAARQVAEERQNQLILLNNILEVWTNAYRAEEITLGHGDQRNKWVGIPVIKAVKQILEEHPDWSKEQVIAELESTGYYFGKTSPARAVHMAFMNLQKAKGKAIIVIKGIPVKPGAVEQEDEEGN